MKVSAEKIDNQQVVLEIEVAVEDWTKAIAEAVKRIAAQVKVPGFRPGKAPRRLLEQRVGKQAILDEAYEIVGPKAFRDALIEQKIELATDPKFETVKVAEGEPLVFKATVTPKPEVKLGEYKGFKIEKTVEEVTDEAVAKHIDQMRERKSTMVAAPEGAEVAQGDFVTLDFKGFVDGEAFAGGEGKDYPLQIGSGSFIPGFEDQLIGAKVGEDRDVNVTFPEEYHEKKLAGKPALFKCTINAIKQKQLPELTDEFVAGVSVFKTVAELQDDVRKNLAEQAEKKAENERRVKAIDTAVDNAEVDIPAVMIEDRINQMVEEFSMRLQQQGMGLDQYFQYSGTTIDQMREQYREVAGKNVKTDLVLEAVAKAENFEVTVADIETEIAMMSKMYNATVEQIRKVISEQGRIGDLAVTVLRRKTAQFIVGSITE